MKIYKLMFFCMICILLYACNTGVLTTNSLIPLSSSTINHILVDTVCFKSGKIVKLETNDNSLLRELNRICYDDNKLFIFDRTLDKIVIFTNEGHYVTHIHNKGYAQGEYGSTMDFCLDTLKKQIILLCDRPYKIIKYDYNGYFIEEHKLQHLYVNIICNSNLICCNRSYSTTENKELVFFDKNQISVIDETVDVKKNVISNRFYSGNFLNNTLNTYYTRRFDNNLYKINNGKIEDIYTIDFNKYTFHNIESYKDISNEIVDKAVKEKFVYSITNVSESEKYIFFRTNIAIFLLDKDKLEVTGYFAIWNSTLQIATSDYLPVENSTMLASIIPIEMFNRIKDMANTKKGYENITLLNFAQQLKEDDNPIVILYN